ncbi:MAG: APC family permease, partial [Nocardioidaceae bacterium]
MLIGRKLRSTQLGDTLLQKRIALPVFASDALSSVAYAPDEILLTLSMAGTAAYTWSWKIGLIVVVVMLTVIASYRQNVRAYPSGGGDYEVATVNLGPTFGLVVASALLVDYVLTVAVSISSGVQNAASAITALDGHEALTAGLLVVLLMAMNLRGVRESGRAFALPTYCFMICIFGMTVWGLLRYGFGHLPLAPSAGYEIHAEQAMSGLSGAAMAFLLAKAFSSGCAALTGVEAISNGVPAFRKPKSKNAATTLLLLGSIAVTMLMGIIFLSKLTQVHYVDDPATQLFDPDTGMPPGAGYDQHTVIGQLATSVFSNFPPAFYLTIAATGVILVLAANTAFNGFPVLASILARDGYMPRQLHSRGDRLAFSNGIVLLAGFAILLIVAFDAKVTSLIQLYIIGVFVSFTLSQIGMVRHWTRHLSTESDPGERRRMQRSRAINTFGLGMTGVVLVVVLATKFLSGAWIAITAMAILFFVMKAIRHHYDRVALELEVMEEDIALPSRIHAIVLVSKMHKPTLRALAYARASRPDSLEAVTVDVDEEATAGLLAE